MCELVNIKNSIGKDIKVASIKAYILQKIITYASLCKKINYIYLFGSSVTERCTEQSDIDLAILSNTSMSKLVRDKGYQTFKEYLYNIDIDQEYDFLYFRTLTQIQNSNEFVCRDIMTKGTLLYQKE